MPKQRKEEILSKAYFKQNSSFETFIITTVLFVFLPIISFRCDWFPLDLSPEWVVDIGQHFLTSRKCSSETFQHQLYFMYKKPYCLFHFVQLYFFHHAFYSFSLVDYLCQNHQMVIRNTYLITLVVHLAEAVVAMMLCSYMDYENTAMFKWGFSVFVHGVFSLRHLLSELFRYYIYT